MKSANYSHFCSNPANIHIYTHTHTQTNWTDYITSTISLVEVIYVFSADDNMYIIKISLTT